MTNPDTREALAAFVKAYGSQDSHTKGLDDACAMAKEALRAPLPPTLNSGADREAIAKLIDPASFNDIHIARVAAHRRQSAALEKADAILSLRRAVDGGAVERNDLIGSIQHAVQMLSTHIEEFHDFDYEPHQVPIELQGLKNIQHHLEGSLIDDKGEPILPRVSTGGAAGEPVACIPMSMLRDLHDILEVIPDWSDAGTDTWILYKQTETFLYPERGLAVPRSERLSPAEDK